MSKRFVFDQQHGERKKAKLAITRSDHNFPLSQMPNNKVPEQDNWGDDNDDEILLLASQACEEAYNDSIPDYSFCMRPESTSTQFEVPASTSKTPFTFKKPSSNIPNTISTQLKKKCSTISSPLPGMSAKMTNSDRFSLSDDLVFNDKVCKGQDSDYVYRQLLKLQEENAKLKSENGKLLEKCVTKEGEASILRTQLKSSQVAVDNARMEKLKAQEKVQMEWTEKLAATNNQVHDLRTQLDFKNLEIISVKEKCKKLESTKLKLTQITVGNNDISSSHRNPSSAAPNDSMSQIRRVKTSTNAVQTENQSHFLKLHKTQRKETSNLTSILPLILEISNQHEHSILDYNDKLQKPMEYSNNKCRIFSTFHRIPSTPSARKEGRRGKVDLSDIYEDLTYIAADNVDLETLQKRYFSTLNALKSVLEEVELELKEISRRVTTAFHKEMDERYIDATASFVPVNELDLLGSRSLYKDEQAISARRITSVMVHVLKCIKSKKVFKLHEEHEESKRSFLDYINRICVLLDINSCAILYSGFLLSLTMLLEQLFNNSRDNQPKILDIIKVVLSSRPMAFVSCHLLGLVRRMSVLENFLSSMCPGSGMGNLKVDHDQGVLLYRKESCHFQVFLKQVEAALKCVEKQKLTNEALSITQNLVALYSNISDGNTEAQDRLKCDCRSVMVQVVVYALRICAVMLKRFKKNEENDPEFTSLLGACRCGVVTLAKLARDPTPLPPLEGHLMQLTDILADYKHSDTFGNLLAELTSTFQVSPEETSSSYHKQPWMKSFQSFSLSD